MKQLLLSVLLFVGYVAVTSDGFAQPLPATRVYPVGDFIAIADSLGQNVSYKAAATVTVEFSTKDGILLAYPGLVGRIAPTRFLNANGASYGASVLAAQSGWNGALLTNSTVNFVGGGGALANPTATTADVAASVTAVQTTQAVASRVPNLLTATSQAAINPALVGFWPSETAMPGEEISVQGSFPSTVRLMLAYPDSLNYISLAVTHQGAGIIKAMLPTSLPVGVYQLWLQTGSSRGQSIYVNRVKATAFNSPLIYAGGPLKIKGQNLILGANTPTIRFVSTSTGTISYGKYVANGSDAYSMNVTAPGNLVAGQSYKVYVNNGYDPVPDGVQVMDEATGANYSIAAIAPKRDIYELGVGWSAVFTDTPFSLTLTGFSNNETGFVAALNDKAQTVANNGGGIVWLPDGNYTQDGSGFLGYTCFNNVVIRAIHDGRAQINYGNYAKAVGSGGGQNFGFYGIVFNCIDNTNDRAPGLFNNNQNTFFKKCWIYYAKSQWLEYNGGRNFLIADCILDCFGSRDNNGMMGFTNTEYVTVRDNEFTQLMGPSFIQTRGLWFTGNTLVRDWNRPKEQATQALHNLVIPYQKSAYVAYNRFNLVGQVARNSDGTPVMNDGETPISEQSDRPDFSHGTVTSTSGLVMTDANANFPGSFLRSPVVAIIIGKGAGQIRNIIAHTATSLTIDKAWDVVPDATSGYETFNWGMENTALVGNRLENQQRGITLYHNPMYRVDLVGNNLLNSGGIDITTVQVDDAGRQTFTPMYNVNLLSNYADSRTDKWQGALMGVQAVQHLIPQSWGTVCTNLRMAGNTLINAATAKPVIQDEPFPARFNAYLVFHPLATNYQDQGVPFLLGTILSGNKAYGGNAAVTLSVGSYYTSIRNTSLLSAPALTDDQTVGGVSHASVNTAIVP